MAHQIITIEKATPESLREMLDLLSKVGLPPEGVEEYLSGFLIARSGGGEVVGCVGLERHGEIGLLRSAAVLPQYQGQWIGGKLIRELLRRASDEGATEVALLTTTAKEYFERKFGFKEAKRARYEKRLQNSPEWNLPRCSSAAFMTLNLKPDTDPINMEEARR
jgi:N-acetylglutamate synthase-like GNAT family acetyltransferase